MKKFFLTTLVAMLCWTAGNAKVNGTEPEDNTPDGVEAVDLGLSVKWANVNMGAKKSTDFGNYYAWGETKPKDYYSWDSYIWSRGNSPMLTKYSVGDRKSQLTLADDAAHANWGGKWRMPTEAECEELADPDNCIWEWTTNNGINGYKVTSKKTGNSIFLPITGFRFYGKTQFRAIYGYYWTSTVFTGNPKNAIRLEFNLDEVKVDYGNLSSNRFSGHCIRAVQEK
jgi:hypothetical protein